MANISGFQLYNICYTATFLTYGVSLAIHRAIARVIVLFPSQSPSLQAVDGFHLGLTLFLSLYMIKTGIQMATAIAMARRTASTMIPAMSGVRLAQSDSHSHSSAVSKETEH